MTTLKKIIARFLPMVFVRYFVWSTYDRIVIERLWPLAGSNGPTWLVYVKDGCEVDKSLGRAVLRAYEEYLKHEQKRET